MTQEIEVVLTLEVDVRVNKITIQKSIENMISFHNDNIKIKSIKEESELYQTDNGLDYTQLSKSFTEILNTFTKQQLIDYLKSIENDERTDIEDSI